MADLQCRPRGSLAPLKYLFDITRERELIHRSNPKKSSDYFLCMSEYPKTGSNGAVAILRYTRMP
jgi:hypothetical protein